MAVSDKDLEEQLAAHREKRKVVKSERKAEAKAAEEPKENFIIVEQDPNGLLYLRWQHQGVLPDALKGRFTSKHKVIQAATAIKREHLLKWL